MTLATLPPMRDFAIGVLGVIEGAAAEARGLPPFEKCVWRGRKGNRQ